MLNILHRRRYIEHICRFSEVKQLLAENDYSISRCHLYNHRDQHSYRSHKISDFAAYILLSYTYLNLLNCLLFMFSDESHCSNIWRILKHIWSIVNHPQTPITAVVVNFFRSFDWNWLNSLAPVHKKKYIKILYYELLF